MFTMLTTKELIKLQLEGFRKNNIECSRVEIDKENYKINFYSKGKIISTISNLGGM